jgi:hypothetical protein
VNRHKAGVSAYLQLVDHPLPGWHGIYGHDKIQAIPVGPAEEAFDVKEVRGHGLKVVGKTEAAWCRMIWR